MWLPLGHGASSTYDTAPATTKVLIPRKLPCLRRSASEVRKNLPLIPALLILMWLPLGHGASSTYDTAPATTKVLIPRKLPCLRRSASEVRKNLPLIPALLILMWLPLGHGASSTYDTAPATTKVLIPRKLPCLRRSASEVRKNLPLIPALLILMWLPLGHGASSTYDTAPATTKVLIPRKLPCLRRSVSEGGRSFVFIKTKAYQANRPRSVRLLNE